MFICSVHRVDLFCLVFVVVLDVERCMRRCVYAQCFCSYEIFLFFSSFSLLFFCLPNFLLYTRYINQLLWRVRKNKRTKKENRKIYMHTKRQLIIDSHKNTYTPVHWFSPIIYYVS